MEKEMLINELQKIYEFLSDSQRYESAGQINSAIDVIEDLFSNKELYGYEDGRLDEVRLLVRKTINEEWNKSK